MISSNIKNSNLTLIEIHELFFQKMVLPSQTFDSIYLYFMIPSSVICIILNFPAFILLQFKQIKNTSLNKYLKV
jgi:hypothetical protein